MPTMTKTERQKLRMQILNDALAVIRKPNVHVVQAHDYVDIGPKRDMSESEYYSALETFSAYARQDAPFHTDTVKKSKLTQCHVCALGSMFLGHVDRHNKLSVKDVVRAGRYEIVDRLSVAFEPNELTAIEHVFEGYEDDDVDDTEDDIAPRAKLRKAAGDLFDRKRLEAMLKFLIKNRGVVE